MSDIQFLLSTNGTRGGVPVTPQQLAQLPYAAKQEMAKEFQRIGLVLLFELKFYFYKMIYERPRNPNYEKGRSEPLLSRMEQSFIKEVMQNGAGDLILHVFDLEHIDKETRNEGFNTANKGWFMRFADGHEGRRHGGQGWGFMPHDLAMKLAQDASHEIGDDKKREQWLADMDEAFKGRHGEGIMVRLDLPLFELLPKFGLAGDFIEEHPGYFSWPAIAMVGKQMVRKDGQIAEMIQAAFDRAVDRITR